MNKKISTTLAFSVIIILAIFLAGISFYLWKGIKTENSPLVNIPKKNKIVACTEEAKLCPDGSAVGRTAPNCEFAPCPIENNVGIANPASVFCEQNGGKLEIVTAEDGSQSGMCKFSDGSQCEEWAFQRGGCKIGDSQKQVDTSDWQTYRNEELGFEIQYPKNVDNEKVNIFNSGNIVWLVAVNNESKYYKDNINLIKSSVSEFEKVKGLSWAILVKNINNDQELDKFIKDRYGKDCKLGEKKQSPQAGMYDVSIDHGKIKEDKGCFLNFALIIKYSPEKHLVVAWDLGQGPSFISSNNKYKDDSLVSYDHDIINSFKFIN